MWIKNTPNILLTVKHTSSSQDTEITHCVVLLLLTHWVFYYYIILVPLCPSKKSCLFNTSTIQVGGNKPHIGPWRGVKPAWNPTNLPTNGICTWDYRKKVSLYACRYWVTPPPPPSTGGALYTYWKRGWDFDNTRSSGIIFPTLLLNPSSIRLYK